MSKYKISEYVDNAGCLDDWNDDDKKESFLYKMIDSEITDDVFRKAFLSVFNEK